MILVFVRVVVAVLLVVSVSFVVCVFAQEGTQFSSRSGIWMVDIFPMHGDVVLAAQMNFRQYLAFECREIEFGEPRHSRSFSRTQAPTCT